MQIERFNNWLTLLGNAGIIISIIVLAYQINEANRVSSAQAFQTRAQMGAEISWTISDSDYIGPILAEVYGSEIRPDIAQLDDLQTLERFRLYFLERAALTLYENNLYQCDQGFLDEKFCEIIRDIVFRRIPYWDKALGGEIPPAYHRVKGVGTHNMGDQ